MIPTYKCRRMLKGFVQEKNEELHVYGWVWWESRILISSGYKSACDLCVGHCIGSCGHIDYLAKETNDFLHTTPEKTPRYVFFRKKSVVEIYVYNTLKGDLKKHKKHAGCFCLMSH